MTTTYYRISPRPMTEADLHTGHVSRLWVGGDDTDERCGLSACEDYESLLSYFTGDPIGGSIGRGAALQGAFLVALEGSASEDPPWEPKNESLIHPTRIVSQEPVSERFIDDLRRAIARRWCDGEGQRVIRSDERDCYVIQCRCEDCDGSGLDADEDDGQCWHCDGYGWVEDIAGDR